MSELFGVWGATRSLSARFFAAGALLTGLVTACGQTARNDNESEASSTEAGAPNSPLRHLDPFLDQGGAASASSTTGPCDCPPADYGVVVALQQSTQRLATNVAGLAQCAPDEPAHVRVISGCDDQVELALAADGNGGAPQLTIRASELVFVDGDGVSWTGTMPKRLGAEPDDTSVLKGTLEVDVTNDGGVTAVLHLDFYLCAEWQRVFAPC